MKLPMPVICDCGFNTMDAKEAIKHIDKCPLNTNCENCENLIYIYAENVSICEHDDIKNEVEDIKQCPYYHNKS